MNRQATLWAAVAALIFAATVCLAHEGEQHGVAAPTAATVGSERHVLSASSKHFELVIKNAPLFPGQVATLDIYVSDFETNAPVRDAAVQLRLRTQIGEIWSGEATATDREGVYQASLTPPDTGTVTIIAVVAAGGEEDQFAIAGLEIATPEQAGAVGGPARAVWRWWYGPVALLLLVILLALGSRHRRRARAASVVALLGLWSFGAHAHEGHDQPPTASGAVAGPGSIVYLGKESQFLLGVRTQLVTQELVKNHHRVLGRVAPRSGGELEIAAPQAGRIYFPGGRTPVLGGRVAHGQVVATLVVIDSLELRSALGGVVTEVAVVNGQLVDAGQKLLRVLDPSVVWVHADIYEQDLERVEKSTVAQITSLAYPGQLLEGRRVALGATLGEVQGTVEAWFEVSNPRGRLRPGLLVDVDIEQEGSESAVVVPRAAMVERDGRSLVFVHMAPELFAAREVMPIASLGDRIAVRGDLEPGERIVVSGSYQLLSAAVVTATP